MRGAGSPARRDSRERLVGATGLGERRLRPAGVSTAVLEGGDGPPAVLLHGGIECGGAYWAPAVSRLVRRHRLVIPDVPGLGESAPVARLDLPAFVAAFSRALGAALAPGADRGSAPQGARAGPRSNRAWGYPNVNA